MMESLITLPASVKVGCSFLGILLSNRMGLPLGVSILLFSSVLSLWSGTGTQGLISQIKSLTRPENYLLLAIVLLLLFLNGALNKSGRMGRTIEALKIWLRSKKLLLAGLPALVGLLPMPGGALFSAPLVDSVDDDEELDPSHKAAINYWFRHIWEYWWPLYPGVILAIRYSGLSVYTYFLVLIPVTCAAVLGGYLFMLRSVRRRDDPEAGNIALNKADAVSALGPIGILVLIAVMGTAFLPRFGVSGTVASLLAMLVGLICALTLVFTSDIQAFVPSLDLFKEIDTLLEMILVIGIQVFSTVISYPLDAMGTTLVALMRDEFIGAGIPLIALIMLIPFISGLLTGASIGFVGSSFPLVFGLLGGDRGLGALAATTVCAYAFGFMGMMISPVHFCFVVTCEYFKTSIYQAYRYMMKPILFVLTAALFLSGLYVALLE